MKKRNYILTYLSTVSCFICNIMLVYVCYMLTRVVFVAENWKVYSEGLFNNSWSDLLCGSLIFDTSAILYTNVLYALLMLLPLHLKERNGWQKMTKWLFVIVNTLGISMNLADAVYFQYTGRRTTASVVSEFSNEGNLGSVFGIEVLRHWYIVLAGLIIIYIMYKAYRQPAAKPRLRVWSQYLSYYVLHALCLAIYVPLTVCGMRGGATTAVRPITISNANQYVNRPAEAAVVLNTPFSIIRTYGKASFVNPGYFSDEELNGIYSPVHYPKSEIAANDSLAVPTAVGKKNVVVLILESFGREYIGAYNERLEDGKYKGYTPFVDSLYNHCVSFDYTFCNGRKSIDGMPSILSSIPMFIEPFILTSSSMNRVSGIAGELGKIGYSSAFFHGAENGSMGFQAFARSTGFQHYYGRTEYGEDKRFNGDRDFDGMWAIWDEPFLQFYALKMSEMKEPFVTAIFTATSHHPYSVPDEYKEIYKDEDSNVIHKCIRYVDNALKNFFDTARRQPWFQNTIFVLTSDHTNLSDHAEYQTDLGGFGSPILIYDPSGNIAPGRRHCIAQQIDIMPTILNYLGYDKPYVAFGKDLFHTAAVDTWAVNYNNGIYQYVKGDYLLQFDGTAVKALYNIKDDWMLTQNLIGKIPDVQFSMERSVKAVIQSYMDRMENDKVVYAE